RKFKLTDHEWKVVEQPHAILKDATLSFSSSMSNLTTLIQAIDHIDKHLTTYAHDKSYLQSICSAMSLAKATPNHYYSATDSSEVYCITMVLHPCHYLPYFKTTFWEDKWIKTAEDL
ncbi:hypothetical protein PAXRUDRAFT_164846, partial [Paxillus rubicundulus Ve08.2h10]